MHEITTLAAFIGMQCFFYNCKHFSAFAILHKVADNHWLIWIFHPTIVHGLQDFVIHFVVYSGKLL